MQFLLSMALLAYVSPIAATQPDTAGLLRSDEIALENRTRSTQHVFVSATETAPAAAWRRITLPSGDSATSLGCDEARYALITTTHGSKRTSRKYSLRCQYRYVVNANPSGELSLASVPGW